MFEFDPDLIWYFGCVDKRRSGRVVFGLAVRDCAGMVERTPCYRRRIKEGCDMALTMSVTQEAMVTVKAIKDRRGNPARIDGVPSWATDNTDVLALTPAADGLSCKVSAVGMMGMAKVQVTVDADLGTGVVPVIGTLDCECTAGPATVIELEAGTPTEIPT
jgi:hypothetical protein